MEHQVTIRFREASEPGAISGKEITCTCGLVITTSLIYCGEAENLAREHIAYMQKKTKQQTATK